MLRRPVTRRSFFWTHFLIAALSTGLALKSLEHPGVQSHGEYIFIISAITSFITTCPANIVLAYVFSFLVEDLFNNYDLRPGHLFLLTALAFSGLALNSWLWSLVCVRKPTVPVKPREGTRLSK